MRSVWALVLVLSFIPLAGIAQTSAPRVALEGHMHASAAHSGSRVLATFAAKLPSGYHVNSSAPLDPFLKPTRLVIDPTEGITVVETTYPEPVTFKTRFSATPLAVYESRFIIGLSLDLADDLATGEHRLKATLKYQACSERVCYPPKTQNTELVVEVVSSETPVVPADVESFASGPSRAE